jgi:hypothetical protein
VHNVPAQVQYGLHFQRVCIWRTVWMR